MRVSPSGEERAMTPDPAWLLAGLIAARLIYGRWRGEW